MGLDPRVARGDRHFGAALQFEPTASLDEHRRDATARAYDRSNRGALAAAGDCANDGAECRTDGAPLHGCPGLAVVSIERAFTIHSDRLSIRRADLLVVLESAVAT